MALFSWGANSHGQLGQGIISGECCTPTKVHECLFDPSSIRAIAGGGGHTLLLDQSGNVYGAGWTNKGQLGVVGESLSKFHLIESLQHHRVSQLACGWDSSIAVTSDGTLLVWGSNNFCQLGFSRKKFSWTNDPKIVPISRIKQASLGLRHLALVTMDGRVLVCGKGSRSQLGISDSTGSPLAEVDQLTLVPNLSNVYSVACGQHHTVALMKSGQVYVWGDNKFGQLGLDPITQPVLHFPKEVPLTDSKFVGRVVSVFCGWTHTVLLTDEGEIINWGRNSYGQLGMERPISWSPALLTYIKNTQQFQVGSEHNIALNYRGEVLSWGWNEHGNCGIGSQDNVLKPQTIILPEKRNALLIGSGACHSFAVLKE